MKVIGITGGVGAGKSRILSILKEEYGARIIEADAVARELQEPGREGLRQMVERFGAEILDERGALDRKAFAKRVFNDPEALKAVNDIIHPLAWEIIMGQVRESRAPFVAVEAALFDKRTKLFCDSLWYVDTSVENRIARLQENRGYTRIKCEEIMQNQLDREHFLEIADVVIDNNGPLKDVRRQIAAILGDQEEGLQR